MIESFYFDLAKNDSTVTSIYSSLNNEPMPVKADDGNTEVFYFKDATAIFSSFTDEPETVKF